LLGRLGRPHGLKGALCVDGRDAPIPPSYKKLFVGHDAAQAVATQLVASRVQGDQVLVTLSLAADRTAIEPYRGQWLWVERRLVVDEKVGGLLWGDLKNVVVEGADGVPLGRVLHVYNAGASDVLAIASESGARYDVPLVADYVQDDDLKAPPASGVLRLKVPAAWFTDL
jgi:16S rRNA processing protein RimM